jgi:hypothetical protein
MSVHGFPILVGCCGRRRMYTDKLILRAEVYAVVNAALEVLKELGHGFHEKPYENALAVELKLRGISCQQQIHFEVTYKGIKVS